MSICPHCSQDHPEGSVVCPNTDRVISLATPPSDPMVGSTLENKYKIERKLGEGGMGAVYVGEHLMMKRKVAIKTLLPRFTSNDNAVQRFQREAQAASNIGHPNIITIHDLGQTQDKTLYIVMELLEGQDLGQEIRGLRRSGGGLLDPRRALGIMRQTAEALAAAHEGGVVHRDLKPDNIFLTKARDGSDRVKLLDFGISKIRTPSPEQAKLTTDGSLLGTPYYMSPEQAQGLPNIDHRADIYAYGIILYELFVGRVPFEDENMLRVIVMHAREEPVPPRHINPSIPYEVENLILRCMTKDPASRVQTMNDVLGTIDGIGASAYGMTFSSVNTTGPLPVVPPSANLLPKTNISGPLPVVQPEATGGQGWGSMGSGPRTVNARTGDTTGPSMNQGSWSGMDSGNVSGAGMTPTPMAWTDGGQQKSGSGLKIALGIFAALFIFGILGAVGAVVAFRGSGDDDVDDGPLVADPNPIPTPQNPVIPANQPPYDPTGGYANNPVVPTNPYGTAPVPNQPVFPGTNPYGTAPVPNPTPPPQTQRVTLAFVSNPSKVQVYRGESRLGTTPFNIQVDRFDQEMALNCRRSGYEEREINVTPNQDQTINIELNRVEAPRGNRPSKNQHSGSGGGGNRPSNPLLKQMPNF